VISASKGSLAMKTDSNWRPSTTRDSMIMPTATTPMAMESTTSSVRPR